MKIVKQTPNRLKLQANSLAIMIIGLLLGYFFLLLGLAIIFSVGDFLLGGFVSLISTGIVFSFLTGDYISTCTFDKERGLMSLKHRSLRRTQVTERMLQEIEQVEVTEEKDSEGDKTYTLRLNLKSGEHIPLSIVFTTKKKVYQKRAECIRQFLNLKA